MKRSGMRCAKYVLGGVLAFIALSNGISVLSNSSLWLSPSDAERTKQGVRNLQQIASPASAGDRAYDASLLNVARRQPNNSLAGMLLKASAVSPLGPALTATKVASPNTAVNPGDAIMYTIEITNGGDADATGVNFTDTIDPNTTLVPGSVAASPIAVNDSYHTIGNVNISVPVGQGVIANDLNPNGSGTLSVTQVNATAVPGGGSATAGTANGSVTMSSDGSFTYAPNAGFRGATDTFTYVLSNSATPGKTDTATVTIAVNGLIWFVDASASGVGADGRLAHPFTCLVGAGCFDPAASDATNDNIFVYSGSYTGGLTLLSAQKLIGQGASQSLLAITGLAAPSGTNLLPATGGSNPTITTSAGGTNALNLGTNDEIWGVTFGNTTGSGIAGTSFGTLKVRDTAKTGNGQALNLSTGTLDAVFQSLSTTNSASTGITINAAAGSMSVTGGTSVTNSTGTAVSLTNNTGTISFAALDISTTATNQSGLVATDNSNTITTTSGAISTGTGTSVNITRASGTTPLNVTLTSVSTNGGANGIILTNTSGSFTVAGDGTNAANGSGGTIQNKTGADGAVAGRGVSLSNVTNFTLNQMNLHDFNNYAIFGSTVTGLTLNYCTINGANGNNDLTDEDSVRLLNLLGSATIDNCTISGGFEDNLFVRNTTGTLNRLTVSNSTIGLNSTAKGDNGIYFEANSGGATAKLTVNSCNFTGSRGDHIDVLAQAGTTASAIITNNSFNNTHTNSLGGGLIVHGAGTMTFDISGNGFGDGTAIHNVKGTVINVGKSATTGTFNGTISNNTIGTSGVQNSGSSSGQGIFVDGGGTTGSMAVAITNNQIHGYGDVGIYLLANSQGGVVAGETFNATVTGNVTDTPDPSNSFAGIFTDIGAFPTDTNAVCLDIGGAGALRNDFSNGDPSDFNDINMSEIGNVTIRLPGYGGTASDTSAITSYLQGRNLNPGTTSVFVGTDTNGYTGGAACGAPNMTGLSVGTIEITSVQHSNGPSVIGGDDDDSILRAAPGEGAERDSVQKLRQEELQWLAQAAVQRWREAGISDEDLARLQAVTFEVADLRGGQIATVRGTSIKVDETGAGYGWFVDNTPEGDYEYDVPVGARELQTTEFSAANGRMDLLTVLVRELGSVYLQGKNRVPKSLRALMQPTLSPSVRRMPVFHFTDPATSSIGISGAGVHNDKLANADSHPKAESNLSPASATPAVFHPNDDLMPGSYGQSARRLSYATAPRRVAAFAPSPFSGETVSLPVGTIPPGEKVVIMFSVTVNSPFPNGVCSVTNQGHVTGGNFSPLDTNSVVNTVNKPLTIGACPANIIKNTDPGLCTAVVTYTTPTADGCPAPTVTCSPASNTAFAKGITTVTCTATNGNPPDATCTFTVTVNDTQAPTITCPANVIQGTDAGVCTAVVTYANATASDNCPGVGTPLCTPASGTTFAKGTTTVTCNVSDASTNSANCSFTVTVNDTTAPSITCPASITQSTDPNVCTAVVTYSNATATDNCPGVGTPVCSPSSGTTFVKGVTTVTCSVSDASSNSANCSFTVTVKDTQAPNLGPCPANISVTSGGGCQVVNYTPPTATDNCGSAAVNCLPASGTCFAPGTTTVTCTASDTSPDSPDSSCSFTVTVVPCTITCPSNISVNNTPNMCGAAVTYAPSFGAGCGTVICSPSSGSFFPVGTTTVMCTTTAGPACSFTVTVADAQAPTITTCPPNRTISTNGGNQIALPSITGEVVATDNCTPSGSLVITQSPVAGTMVGLGSTFVTITVKDAANNQSTCVVTITVVRFAAKDFVVFSSEYTKLNANATVNTGNVGANNSLPDPNGPPDDKEEVEIGERVTMLQAGSSVVGDTVRLRANSSVYNVYFNESFFSPSATILGSQVTPLSLPVTTMPAFPTVTPGTTDVVVPANSTVTLAPGSYRNVTVNNKGTLKLTGGLYQISSLDIRQEANIFCLAQTEVRVKIEMDTDAKAFIGPDASVPSLQASQIIFYVEGADGGGGLSPTAVQIGERNTVFANIYAVNGTVVLKANTIATGAFFGKLAQIGERVELTLKSAF